MSYKYRDIPKRESIVWIKLIKEYKGEHDHLFPSSLKVGDKTWVRSENWYNKLVDSAHIEGNRYCGNFKKEYFELVKEVEEPIYEIF